LSDVAVGSALGYLDFRFPEVDWRTPHANLHRLYDRLMQRSSFKDTCPS
jgi:glutathione S-transferase